MPSLFDKLFEGKRSLTLAEYNKQKTAIKKIVNDHREKLTNLTVKVSNGNGLTKEEKNLFLKQIDFMRNILNRIKPKALTDKDIVNYNTCGKWVKDKKEQDFFQTIKAQDKELYSFNELYKEVEPQINNKIKSDKPASPLIAFEKARKESKEDNKEAILTRLKAQGAKATEIKRTSPRK